MRSRCKTAWPSLVWIFALSVAVGAGTVAVAQEVSEPSKHEGDWYRLVHVDYKPGKTNDALKIVAEHFAPASATAETPGPVMSLVHESGPWDVTWLWHLSGGPADLEWNVTPTPPREGILGRAAREVPPREVPPERGSPERGSTHFGRPQQQPTVSPSTSSGAFFPSRRKPPAVLVVAR